MHNQLSRNGSPPIEAGVVPPASQPGALRRHRALIVNLLKYSLGFGLLGFLIWYNWKPGSPSGLAALWHEHIVEGKPIHFLPLVLAVSICIPAILLTFVRWYVLVRAQELPFTLTGAMRLGLIGNALNVLLPGSIGGDVIKATCLAREQSRRTVAVATVLIDRAIGLWGLIWLMALVGATCWAFGWLHGETERMLHSIVLSAVGIVTVTVLVWLLLGVLPPRRADRFARRLEGIPKVGHSAAEFWRAIWMYRCKGRSVALALAMSVVGHVGFVLTFYFAALTIFAPALVPSLAEHYLVVPIGMAIEAGFPTPGGVGGGELVYQWLYDLMGKPGDNGLPASLVRRVIYWIPALVGYLVYLRLRPALVADQESEETAAGAPAPRTTTTAAS